MAALDDLDVERVVTSIDGPLQQAVRQMMAFRRIDDAGRAAVNERFVNDAVNRYRDFFDRVEPRPLTTPATSGFDRRGRFPGAGRRRAKD